MGCASEEFFARATTPLGYHDGAASRRCSCPRCYACCCTCCCPICSRWTLRGPMRIAPACCHQTPARRPAVDVEQHSLSRCSASSSLRGGAWSVSSAPAERCAAIRRACFDLPSNRPARRAAMGAIRLHAAEHGRPTRVAPIQWSAPSRALHWRQPLPRPLSSCDAVCRDDKAYKVESPTGYGFMKM